MRKQLEDLELGAAMKPVGIWAKSDPDRLAQLRKKQRQEDEELKEIQRIDAGRKAPKIQGTDIKGMSTESLPRIDINKATKRQLQAIRGIGEERSQGIIDGQPHYKSLDDVRKVKGIGPEMLKRLRTRFYVP